MPFSSRLPTVREAPEGLGLDERSAKDATATKGQDVMKWRPAPSASWRKWGVLPGRGQSPREGSNCNGSEANYRCSGKSFEHLGEALLQDYIYYRDLLQGERLKSICGIGF